MIIILLEPILLTTVFIYEEEKNYIPILLQNGFEYSLKCNIVIPEERSDEFSECIIEIINLNKPKELILKHKFTNNYFTKFKCEDISPLINDICLCGLFYKFPQKNDPGAMILFKIYGINSDIINKLNISIEKRKTLTDILNHYLNDRPKACINETVIFAEYIARELARKAKGKDFSDFGSAVEALSHYKVTSKTKINYSYLGSLLWPLYYLRNQKLHPYAKIPFNQNICDIIFKILSLIILYISQKGIKF